MMDKSVLILGSGHLADRTKSLLVQKKFIVNHLSSLFLDVPDKKFNTINEIKKAFDSLDMTAFSIIYVLFEKDEDNLELVIALMALYPSVTVATSLFNENISQHLQSANPKLTIINPAKIAAPSFTEALDYPLIRKKTSSKKPSVLRSQNSRGDLFLILLTFSFAFISISVAAYFHYKEQLSWLDAFYFVVVTISTVGYGDINLLHSDALSKVVGISLILCSSVFIWMIFSLLIDRILKRRAQHSLGRKKYNYKDHIILCGLGRLGYFIAEELKKNGQKIVIIEQNEESPNIEYFRNNNVDVYIGNARHPDVLQNAGAEHCRALISVLNDDYANLDIGLNARYFQPELRLVLRIFDESMATIIKEKFDIHLTKSMSFITAERFSSILNH